MKGRTVAGIIGAAALIAGASIYYLQVYAFYQPVAPDAAVITLVPIGSDAPEPIRITGFEGIDASSSPLRFRACFALPEGAAELAQTYQTYAAPEPLNGPGWFDCFNSGAITGALESGDAVAFLSARNIGDGVDRVIAVYPDGRAFAWHQLNEKYRD